MKKPTAEKLPLPLEQNEISLRKVAEFYEETNHPKKALHYYKLAAEQKDLPSLSKLTDAYRQEELGVHKSYKQALNYEKQAVEAGSPTSLYNVGLHYQEGKGCQAIPKTSI